MEKNLSFEYVPYHQKGKWEEVGWEFFCDLEPPEAAYASLYVWDRSGLAVRPDGIDIKIARPVVTDERED